MHQDARRYLIAVVLLLIGAGGTQVARGLRVVAPTYKVDFSKMPATVGAFKSEVLPVAQTVYDYLQPAAMEERVYQSPDRQVLMSVIYGTDWRSIHAPTGCYPAQGWQILENHELRIPAPAGCPHPGPINARQLLATKDGNEEMALFVYARPGATTADWTMHVTRMISGKIGAGGLILILKTQVVGDDNKGAQRALVEILSAVYPGAVGFWYPKGQAQTQTAG